MRSTTFPMSPGVTIPVKVVIHESELALKNEWRRLENCEPGGLFAFCHYQTKGFTGENLCELHFDETRLAVTTIAHEALHAVLLLGRYLRLNLDHEASEEMLAESMEQIVLHTLKFQKEKSVSKSRVILRPQFRDRASA